MGYEYECVLPRSLKQAEIKQIFAAVLVNQDYELVELRKDRMFLRFIDLPRDEDFLRDIELYCKEKFLLVVFYHRGERSQKFLQRLSDALQTTHLSGAFEEV